MNTNVIIKGPIKRSKKFNMFQKKRKINSYDPTEEAR